MTAKSFADLGFFSGLNKRVDPTQLRFTTIQTPLGYKAVYPLVEAMNVDIDDSFKIVSRTGLTNKITGSNLHSIWANSAGTKCFLMDGRALLRLDETYATTDIAVLSSQSRVSWAEVNELVYLTNSVDIGYIESDVYSQLAVSTFDFKLPLPAGKFISYFKGRIYLAKGSTLYISDVNSHYYDTRYGYRRFSSDITMVLPVTEGVYVSDSTSTYFLHIMNNSNQTDQISIKREFANDRPAIPYTGIQVDGRFVSENGIDGEIGIWVSQTGICIGVNSGKVLNVSERNYLLSGINEGASLFRYTGNKTQFISILRT